MAKCLYILQDLNGNQIASIEAAGVLEINEIVNKIVETNPYLDVLYFLVTEQEKLPELSGGFSFVSNISSEKLKLIYSDGAEFDSLLEASGKSNILFVTLPYLVNNRANGTVLGNTIIISPVLGHNGSIDVARTTEVIKHELIHALEDKVILENGKGQLSLINKTITAFIKGNASLNTPLILEILNTINSYKSPNSRLKELNAYYKTNPEFRNFIDLALGENHLFQTTSFDPSRSVPIANNTKEITQAKDPDFFPIENETKLNPAVNIELNNLKLKLESLERWLVTSSEIPKELLLQFKKQALAAPYKGVSTHAILDMFKSSISLDIRDWGNIPNFFWDYDLPFYEADFINIDSGYQFQDEIEELKYKKTGENWKEELEQRNKAIGTFFANYNKETPDNMYMEYGEYYPIDKQSSIISTLKQGSIVYLPLMEYKSKKAWKALGITGEGFLPFNEIYSQLSALPSLNKEQKELFELANKFKDRSRKHYIVYSSATDSSSDTMVSINYSFGQKHTVVKVPAEYVKGYRRFKGKYTQTKLSNKKVFQDIIKEFEKSESGKPVEFNYSDDYEEFNDEEISFKRTISVGNYEVTQFLSGTMGLNSGFGNLNPILKSAQTGEVIKFSITEGKVKKGQKIETRTGVILENGNSGLRVLYKDGRKYVETIVPYNKVYYYHFDSNKSFEKQTDFLEFKGFVNKTDPEAFDKMSQEERKEAYADFVKQLYDKDSGYSNRIVGFSYLSDFEYDIEGTKVTQEEAATKAKILALNKVKPGSVVKYVYTTSKGPGFKYGRYFFHDNKYVYLFPEFKGQGLIKIPIVNNPGKWDKEKKKVVNRAYYNYKGEVTLYGNAIETVFPDTTREASLVQYFDSLKDNIDNNLSSYLENKIDNFTNTIKQVKNKANGFLNLIKLATAKKTDSLSLEQEFEPVRFFRNTLEKIEDKRKLKESERLISEDSAAKELSKAQIGDAIRFFSTYGKEDKNYFIRKAIITDIDDLTGFPIISYTDAGRIKSQIVYPNLVEVLYKRITPYNLEVVDSTTGEVSTILLPGRLKEFERRKELLSKFMDLETKDLFITKLKAEGLVLAINERNNYTASRFAIERIYKYNGKITFTKDAKRVDEFESEKNPNNYRIVKLYFKDKSWHNFYGSYNEYKLGLYPLMNPEKYNFDQLKKVLKYGSIVEFGVQFGNNKYPTTATMFVEEINSNAIKGSIMTKDGERKPVYIFRTSKYPTFIKEIYNGNYNNAPKANEFEKDRDYTTSISETGFTAKTNNTINSSKSILDLSKLKQTGKNKKPKIPFSRSISFKSPFKGTTILTKAVNKILSLYNTTISMYTDNDIETLSKELDCDLSNARGLVKDRVIHINASKATDADVLHELAHMIMPGIKFHNKNLWDTIMDKIQEHPLYDIISKKYPELSGEDLNEEVFVTIFGEYYSKKYLSTLSNDWFNNTLEFKESLNSLPNVLGDIFDLNVDIPATYLGNKTISELFDEFGNKLVKGEMDKYYYLSNLIQNNTVMQNVLETLIRENKVLKIC